MRNRRCAASGANRINSLSVATALKRLRLIAQMSKFNLFGITNGIYALVDSFGSVLNRVSGRGKCRKSYGSVNGVSWVYYTTGRNCETAPEVSNIKGAVKNHLETNDGKTICGMECLDLTQPRDWNGFLLIGPTSNFDTTCTAGRLCLSTLILLA
ncbi:hypothetical protein DL98DRAFT_518643 [Cadophora sp. DSE1049]|nr:hypothetical protein DL98DRAFT_518643 [Cadophora sp. DSE1049]